MPKLEGATVMDFTPEDNGDFTASLWCPKKSEGVKAYVIRGRWQKQLREKEFVYFGFIVKVAREEVPVPFKFVIPAELMSTLKS